MDENVNILVQSSDYYAPMLGVMLTSLFENNKDAYGIHVFLMTSDMSQKNRDKFLRLAEKFQREIEFVDTGEIDQMLTETNVPHYIGSYAAYYKLFALSMLPNSVDKLLFLDADMVILDSLSELFHYEFKEDKMLAISQSITISNRYAERLKVNEGRYYNTGTILFDTKKWIDARAQEKIIWHLKNVHSAYPYADEGLLNVLFHEQIEQLPLRYNLLSAALIWKDWKLHKIMYGLKDCYSKEEFERVLENPTLIHFASPPLGARPWCSNENVPDMYWAGCDKWREYWKKSLWSDCPLMEFKLSFRSKGIIFCQRILPPMLFARLYGFLVEKNAMALLKQYGL